MNFLFVSQLPQVVAPTPIPWRATVSNSLNTFLSPPLNVVAKQGFFSQPTCTYCIWMPKGTRRTCRFPSFFTTHWLSKSRTAEPLDTFSQTIGFALFRGVFTTVRHTRHGGCTTPMLMLPGTKGSNRLVLLSKRAMIWRRPQSSVVVAKGTYQKQSGRVISVSNVWSDTETTTATRASYANCANWSWLWAVNCNE